MVIAASWQNKAISTSSSVVSSCEHADGPEIQLVFMYPVTHMELSTYRPCHTGQTVGNVSMVSVMCHFRMEGSSHLTSNFLQLPSACLSMRMCIQPTPFCQLVLIAETDFRKGIYVGPISRCSPVTIPVHSFGFPNLSRSGGVQTFHVAILSLVLCCSIFLFSPS